jgi:hypothetical protein
MAHFIEDCASHAVRRAGVTDAFQEDIGLAGTGKPGRAIVASLDMGEQVGALSGRDLVVNVP